MTITIDLEELRKHNDALLSWTVRRAQAFATWLERNYSLGPMSMGRELNRPAYEKMKQEWDTANPMPILISAV